MTTGRAACPAHRRPAAPAAVPVRRRGRRARARRARPERPLAPDGRRGVLRRPLPRPADAARRASWSRRSPSSARSPCWPTTASRASCRLFGGIERARFRRQVGPGRHRSSSSFEMARLSARAGKGTGRAEVAGSWPARPTCSSSSSTPDSTALQQAMGLAGEPVPPSTTSGATVNRKLHCRCAAHASARRSRRRLSSRCTPIADDRALVDGHQPTCGSSDRAACRSRRRSRAPPTSRACSHARTPGARPASPPRTASHGPSSARRASRPVATSRMSPSLDASRRCAALGGIELVGGDRRRPVRASRHPVRRGTSSSTPRPTMPSKAHMMLPRRAPVLVTSVRREPVVHLAVHEDVAERVDVRGRHAVERHADEVARSTRARGRRACSRRRPGSSWCSAGRGFSGAGSTGSSGHSSRSGRPGPRGRRLPPLAG